MSSRGRRFERYRVASSGLELAVDICLAAWILSGPHIALRDHLSVWTSHRPAVIALYTSAMILLALTVRFPLEIFRSFALPRAMGQSHESAGRWAADWAKGNVLGLGLAIGLAEWLFWLLHACPSSWWIIAAAGLCVLMLGLSAIAPIIIFPLFFTFTPITRPALRKRIRALARAAHVRAAGVYEFALGKKSRAANAALVGIGRTRRIILSDTLLKNFRPAEIDAVVAHEMGHHALHHLWAGIALQGALMAAGLYAADAGLARLSPAFGLSAKDDIAALPLLALLLGAAGLLTLPLASAAHRLMERSADRFCLRMTGNPSAFISTMKKLARLNLANPDPHPAVEVLLYTHPPIRKRIAMAREWGKWGRR